MRNFILKLNEELYTETELGKLMLKLNEELYAETE
jgi:hypothetical protein